MTIIIARQQETVNCFL